MSDPGLEAAYALGSPDDHRRLYARWASTYDEDFVEGRRYVYPRTVAAHVAAALGAAGGRGASPDPAAPAPTTAPPCVVDVGCGTGALAETLALLRPDADVDGLDISPEMLAVARAKRRPDGTPLYRELVVADLTASPGDGPLGSLAGRYDVVASVGTFTHGHLGPEVLATVAALARPGGRLVIGINEAHFDAHGFGAALDSLVATGTLRDATTTRVWNDQPTPTTAPGAARGDAPAATPAAAPADDHSADTALVLTAVRSPA
ncbi:MAG: class I SAM-dependent DNA methyltransferase [Acidimicrobiia bacterium]